MKTHTKSLIRIIRNNIDTSRRFDGAEIGVWKGENSAALLETFPKLHLCMVDAYSPGYAGGGGMGQLPQEDFDAAKAAARLATKKYFEEMRALHFFGLESKEVATGLLRPSMFSFVFLDASHAQDAKRDMGIATDIRLWRERVLPGGILCGHDYDGKGDRRGWFCVKKSVDEAFGDRVNVEPGLIWWVKI